MAKVIPGIASEIWTLNESTLMQLDRLLESADFNERQEFTDCMYTAFKICRLNISRFAADMKTSTPTAHRWVSGVSAPPNRHVWNAAVTWIREEIERILNDVPPIVVEQRQAAAASIN